MSRSEELTQVYATNTWLIGTLIEGVNHNESLLQSPFPANCVNWIVGHILVSRNESMHLCGGKMWDDALIERYKSDSQPIDEGDKGVRNFDELLNDLQSSQEILFKLFAQLSEEDLNQVVETSRGKKPRWQHIRGLHWHETYHMGQLELLRSFILSLRGTEG